VEGAVKVFVLTGNPCCCCGQSVALGVVEDEEAAKLWVASEPGTGGYRDYEGFDLNELP
jgi:hypothetical protein